MSDYKEKGIRSICGREYTHWGNNAQPVNDGRCCDDCNMNVVLPARFEKIFKNMKEE